MGEHSGHENGSIRMGTSGHLWGVLGDTTRAGLCQASKSKVGQRSPSFLTIPIPSAFKERELSKDKWEVKRKRMFLSIGAEELDCRGLGRSWSLLRG